jgi:pimeloyl-ACP methyl ester carboxylesterase
MHFMPALQQVRSTSVDNWFSSAWEYFLDSSQRSILFWDILRRRGNVYLEHLRKGQPPVLVFSYEVIADGRKLEHPVNYSLVRILDRRIPGGADRRRSTIDRETARADRRRPGGDRRHRTRLAVEAPEAVSRPIVIIDPRAGHGPGIGGSKQDSQIGMALDAGHPVYFLLFTPEPCPQQTLTDVRNAHIRFIEEVRSRHLAAPKPAVIGNCQGGWAAALIGAERPDLVGPLVFNGSPLSYWGGVEGANPLRYRGGLVGGVWINSFLSDLGNGTFDGAHLVANFEDLNPANTLWSKPYRLYANVDTEENRYLEFERWWGGFFNMTRKEIHTIVDSLFMGNKLEQGELELEKGRLVDLKNNTNPVVVFASFGDNITPPQQAYNWISKVYGSVEEIRRRGQVIVVHLHETIGHLGIFVSAKIARKQHKEIIASFDMLDYLPPGLYEMVIEEDPLEPGEYQVRFLERNTDEILNRETPALNEQVFGAVQAVSRFNDNLYRLAVAPWVQAAVSDLSAELFRQLHPLRLQRILLSDLNPWLIPLKTCAAMIRNDGRRRSVSENNAFRRFEEQASDGIVTVLDRWRDLRDSFSEHLFKLIYANPWMRLLYPAISEELEAEEKQREALRRKDANRWRKAAAEGGFSEAVVRMMLALLLADGELPREGYEVAGRLIRRNERMRRIGPQALKEIVRTQARILQTDTDLALETLPLLLAGSAEREEALALLQDGIDSADRAPNPQERSVLEKITAILEG